MALTGLLHFSRLWAAPSCPMWRADVFESSDLKDWALVETTDWCATKYEALDKVQPFIKGRAYPKVVVGPTHYGVGLEGAD